MSHHQEISEHWVKRGSSKISDRERKIGSHKISEWHQTSQRHHWKLEDKEAFYFKILKKKWSPTNIYICFIFYILIPKSTQNSSHYIHVCQVFIHCHLLEEITVVAFRTVLALPSWALSYLLSSQYLSWPASWEFLSPLLLWLRFSGSHVFLSSWFTISLW